MSKGKPTPGLRSDWMPNRAFRRSDPKGAASAAVRASISHAVAVLLVGCPHTEAR
jgi:hypothetical protein